MNILELSEQEIIRRNSLNELRAMGIDPYPAAEYVTNAFSTDIKAEFKDDEEPRQVSVAGRIMSRRVMGKASFVELQDSKGRIQVYITRDDICPGEDKELYNSVFKRLLDLGDFIGIEGFVFRTQMGEISIHAKKLTVLAKSIKPLPIVKYKDGVAYDSFEDPELRYRQRYVDLVVNDGIKETFLKRATVVKTLRNALDEAGSRVHLTNITVPKEIEEQEKLIEEARQQKADAVKSQNFELAASFRDHEKEFSARLEEMKAEWEARLKDDRQIVGEEEIANVVSMMSGVPVQRMAQAEGIKLAGMKEELQAKVIAQDPAIEKVTKAILRSRVGLKDPNRPIGTFLFLGPTGVGKTHLAKQLAKYMFGSADALIRVDMSEYMEKFTVSRLVGAPPGYVGYEEGGQLTEKVRRKPYSIILLDEIEKAHPDVFNLLLQVMDEGRLTDSYGRMVDFKNTVIIMTSNIGTRQLKDFGRGVGFATQNRLDDKEFSRSVIQKALNKSFAPEFLNRVDEIITFDQLSLEAITHIIDIELKGLYDRIESIGYKLVIEDEAKQFIATKGYDVQYGARPLKRAIQTYLEDGLSELIISSKLTDGDMIRVSLNKEKGELEMKNEAKTSE